MSKETNIAAQEKFGQAANTGNFDLFDEVVAPDALDHDPAPDQGRGPEGFKTFFGMMRSAFPDLGIAVDHMVADEDNVSIAYTVTGTHQGEFQGVEPTGKSFSARGCQIARFEDGKLVERWGSSDELGILQQLDAVNIQNGEDDKGLMDKLTGR